MLKTTVVLKMLNLNKYKNPEEPEDFTSLVLERLRNLNVNVVRVPYPVIHLESSGPDLITIEIISKIADDLDYAIAAINEYNPIIVFLREVTKEPNGKFKFRFQYIAQAEIKGEKDD